ncbi:hypothetical protein SteCoe_4545 [Stentor coeruleus]|uniref:Glycerophosphocholine acyltransferase 1 n=1 Tax=Stentor coeruleus TaxID=5963 RepID=A0A1R2CUG4_9CILI|nr:hypothetical protein SteCoe_4545 [Stentor coeruleus]
MGWISTLAYFHTEHHYKESKGLLVFRLISVVFTAFYFLFCIFFDGIDMFVYITYWAITITFLYFLIVSIGYKVYPLRRISYVIFEIIWPMNIMITLMFWCYYFPFLLDTTAFLEQRITSHTFPVVVTIGDFCMSNIIFYRAHYIYPIFFMVSYAVAVLYPYTVNVSPIYIGVTFDNGITYIILMSCLLIIVISLEVARFIKVRSCCSKKNIIDNSESCSYKQDIDKENNANLENPSNIVDYENKQSEFGVEKHDLPESKVIINP